MTQTTTIVDRAIHPALKPTTLRLSIQVQAADIVSLLAQHLMEHREDHTPAFLETFGWINHGLPAALRRTRKHGHKITRDEFLSHLLDVLVLLAQATMEQREKEQR